MAGRLSSSLSSVSSVSVDSEAERVRTRELVVDDDTDEDVALEALDDVEADDEPDSGGDGAFPLPPVDRWEDKFNRRTHSKHCYRSKFQSLATEIKALSLE